jgi:NADPH:quinone reductase-like Zn-dependent oxidoreductase
MKINNYDGQASRVTLEKLNRLIEAGPFEVHVDRTFPLEQAAEAQKALGQHHLGKIALTIS